MSHGDSQLIPFSGAEPRLGRDVFLAQGARVVGDVRLGDRVSIWFNTVLRGDINRVEIGDGSNIQDNATCHVDDDYPCLVGRDCVVGHAAILHGCTVADRCLIGMSATLLNGVRIGEGAVVAAGTLHGPADGGHRTLGSQEIPHRPPQEFLLLAETEIHPRSS